MRPKANPPLVRAELEYLTCQMLLKSYLNDDYIFPNTIGFSKSATFDQIGLASPAVSNYTANAALAVRGRLLSGLEKFPNLFGEKKELQEIVLN